MRNTCGGQSGGELRSGEHSLYVAGNQVDLEVHRLIGGEAAQGGVFERVRNQVDAEFAAAG